MTKKQTIAALSEEMLDRLREMRDCIEGALFDRFGDQISKGPDGSLLDSTLDTESGEILLQVAIAGHAMTIFITDRPDDYGPGDEYFSPKLNSPR
jgi:hypothetical protein